MIAEISSNWEAAAVGALIGIALVAIATAIAQGPPPWERDQADDET